MSFDSNGSQVTSKDFPEKTIAHPDQNEILYPIISKSSDGLPAYTSKSQIMDSPSPISPNFVTSDDKSYRMSQSSQILVSSNSSGKGWRSFSSREKALSIALGIVSVLCIGLMIAVVIVGLELNQDDYAPTLKPTKPTELPPWVTTQRTTTGTSGCGTDAPGGTISPRPTTTRPPANSISDAETLCLTPDCINSASKILTNLNPSVNPCDDFYQFACGGWIKENPIPESESRWSQFSILGEKMVHIIRGILESKPQKDDPEPLHLSQIYYKICMEQENDESPLLHQLLKDVRMKTENDSANTTSLEVTLGKIRRMLGGNYLFTLHVREDEKNGSVNTIYMDQPNFGILPSYFLDEKERKYVEAYRELMQNIWTDFFPGDDFKTIVENVLGFETALAKISAPPSERRNKTEMYNALTIEDLYSFVETSSIGWMNYLEEVFQDVINESSSFKLTNSTQIVIKDLLFFEHLQNVLAATNEETITNYLTWRILLDFAEEANENYRNYAFNYNRKTYGNEIRQPTWKRCSSQTEEFLSIAISYRYVKDRFKDGNYKEFLTKFDGMVDSIKRSFLEILDEIDWIADNETRRVAKQKAENMKTFIGFPEWLMDNDHAGVLNHYAGFALSNSSSHLQSYVDANRWTSWHHLKRISETNDGKRWVMSPITINAAYDPNVNSITVPIGLLQPPFYSDFGNDTVTLNYGALGAVIGHEITHAFDDRGRQNDEHGNLRDWWDTETLANYMERDTCFQNQYGRFSEEILGNNIKVNGLNTLGENIADNGGVREAYSALLRYTMTNGGDKPLPGVSYSQEQLFFLSYAQVWCASSKPQALDQLIHSDVHSPPKFRVKGVMENSEAFPIVWSCPRPANSQICKIWG